MKKNIKTVSAAAATALATALIGFAAASCNEGKASSQKASESAVVTNANGSVSRTFTECTVSTNGSLVTEHRRETRTTMDAEGNVLESSTSEYAQSYTAGDVGLTPLPSINDRAASSPAASDTFMGLGFGTELKGTNFVADAEEPTLLRTTFVPKKTLAGFDDYYAYVTPKTHRIVKVCACAREAVDPGSSWRRHYLIEALEKRYQTWARPRSSFRPVYTFDIGGGRYVTTCLAGASRDYETVVVAWDDALLTTAADETEQLRAEARKNAAERRKGRVADATAAF